MWCDYDTTAADAVVVVNALWCYYSSSSPLLLLLLLPSHSLFSFPKWENFDLALTQLTHFALHLVDYHCCCLKSDSLFITDCIMLVHTLNPNFIFFCVHLFLFPLKSFDFACILVVVRIEMQHSRKILRFMQDWFENPKDKTISLLLRIRRESTTDEILLPSQMSPSSRYRSLTLLFSS